MSFPPQTILPSHLSVKKFVLFTDMSFLNVFVEIYCNAGRMLCESLRGCIAPIGLHGSNHTVLLVVHSVVEDESEYDEEGEDWDGGNSHR